MAEGRNVKNENWDEEIFSRRLEFSLLLFMEFFYYCFPFPSPKKEMEFSVIEDLDFSMIEIIRDRGSRLIFSRRKNFEIRHRNFPRDVRQSRGVIWFLPNCSKILKIKNFSRDRAASFSKFCLFYSLEVTWIQELQDGRFGWCDFDTNLFAQVGRHELTLRFFAPVISRQSNFQLAASLPPRDNFESLLFQGNIFPFPSFSLREIHRRRWILSPPPPSLPSAAPPPSLALIVKRGAS